ncbi:GTP 3',8-cyclase MoaA [Helicobacter marmotae]|uniref:GTP 3',8-cyclase n=1 Tax=Helicobacter marmotae TaxID=152490 RepID=A0A3D8I2U7_9HELI|nr:GTP 3',8-cyclase MoaA [Helicobacter marmotae]RDU59449.1 GTP 3',8-cyclase MoaA [Helicobacter marmotae]
MLIDTFNRKIDYMRVSLTKECNLRCQYCMPDTPQDTSHNQIPLEKMLAFIKVAIDEGIVKIRLTGGEPLLRKGLSAFIADIRAYAPHVEITLTSNALLLEKYAQSLKDAGLSRINISLDSLKSERIKLISKRDGGEQILKGIYAAKDCGLKVKLNMVPLKGINDDEMIDMLHFARDNDFGIRFIEFMENIHAKQNLEGLRNAQILAIINAHYPSTQIQSDYASPAKLYSITHSAFGQKPFIFGIISPHEDDFCATCNRIRLTSDGVICPCLYYQESVVLKDAILKEDKSKMQTLLKLAVQNKPEKNQWNQNISQEQHSARAFYYTGG